jgi:nitroreductase
MNTIEAIKARRAIKHYDPEHKMSADEERQLLELALLSPTAFNIQNWRFVVVRDPEIRKQIRAVAWDQAQVTEASLLIVLCANLADARLVCRRCDLRGREVFRADLAVRRHGEMGVDFRLHASGARPASILCSTRFSRSSTDFSISARKVCSVER